MAVAGRVGFGTSTEHSSRTCWILLKATKAVLRAETGVGVPFYYAGAVAEFDPASWTSGAGAAGAVTATALAVLLARLPAVRLHWSAPASRMPSDPSVPPTTAAPINLRALPRVREPSASPLARSSKKLSSVAIRRPFPERRDSSAPPSYAT
jgi:hypothetical protein